MSPSHFHPMLVHFPIALIAIGFLAEIASLFIKKEVCLTKCGYYLLIVGTISAIIALSTGILFTSEMSGSAGEVKDTHALFAWITIGLLITTSILRIIINNKKTEDSKLKWMAFILYGFAAISVGIVGFNGGTLVYNYMMPL